jgi:UDPglucose--hexose-1-phosphate uridylyltransferase
VITFSPSHNLALADLSTEEIVPIIQAWAGLYKTLLSPTSHLAALTAATTPPSQIHVSAALTRPQQQYRYMQIFENKGATMGCSNPHPHGQVWVTTGVPEELVLEFEQLKKYRREHDGSHLLVDYAQLECEKKERAVFENDAFLAICPWWAVWPFEVMIVSKKHKRSLVDLDHDDVRMLAEAMAEVTRRYDNLFETQFPYSTSYLYL